MYVHFRYNPDTCSPACSGLCWQTSSGFTAPLAARAMQLQLLLLRDFLSSTVWIGHPIVSHPLSGRELISLIDASPWPHNEFPTSNFQFPNSPSALAIRIWLLVIGHWILDIQFPFPVSPLTAHRSHIQIIGIVIEKQLPPPSLG